jgi:hypothetical protein
MNGQVCRDTTMEMVLEEKTRRTWREKQYAMNIHTEKTHRRVSVPNTVCLVLVSSR